MAAVHAEDVQVRASFLFVGYLNGLFWVIRIVMELQHLTLQQSLVVISWLVAQPMHVVPVCRVC